MTYPHLGFKLICSMFMARTFVHFIYNEEYMRLRLELEKQKVTTNQSTYLK